MRAVQQAEEALGPPRSLHSLARSALQTICKLPTTEPQDLDDYFPAWVQYVAAHEKNTEIIGCGLTHARAQFLSDQRDANRGGAPRCDFFFYRTDGTACRVHPGRRPKDGARILEVPAP